MYYQNNQNIPKSYSCDVLEGNWYEDRCIPKYDEEKRKHYKINSPNSWLYDTTYNEIGILNNGFPKLQRFGETNDNFINFQNKDYNMYITTNKYYNFYSRHAYNENYKNTFRKPAKNTDFFKNKPEELDYYRKNWTKREQKFETTYKSDILKVTAKLMTK